MKRKFVAIDVEVYPNCFMIGIMNIENQKIKTFEIFGENERFSGEQIQSLNKIIANYAIATFNGDKYDIPIILKAMSKATCKQIYEMSSDIVTSAKPGWVICRDYDLRIPPYLVHSDLFNLQPGVMSSLKTYGARMHCKKLQDLPYDPHQFLTREEFNEVIKYNANDLDITYNFFKRLEDSIELRYFLNSKYLGNNFLSKSDAQIAETIILDELKKAGKIITNSEKTKFVTYDAPDIIEFKRDDLKQLLEFVKNHKFEIDKLGSPILPDFLSKQTYQIGESKYKFGLGGLHSQEKKMVRESNEKFVLINSDVASYYPSMILEFKFAPHGYEDIFLEIYGGFKKERIKAKREGDKIIDKTYKLTLNSIFGKLGNKYSKIYSPKLMLQVTLTGQLLLLMLIETLENNEGINVISANTDGIEIYCDRNMESKARSIINEWEIFTGMEMEINNYDALYSRDVNNYIAIWGKKEKSKGAYGELTLRKNPEHYVVYLAIKEYLLHGVDYKEFIRNHKNIEDFLLIRNVRGGGDFGGRYLGKVVRWYYSEFGGVIRYKSNNNKVPKSEGSYPMMDLVDEIPDDIDFDKYIEICEKQMKDLGL